VFEFSIRLIHFYAKPNSESEIGISLFSAENRMWEFSSCHLIPISVFSDFIPVAFWILFIKFHRVLLIVELPYSVVGKRTWTHVYVRYLLSPVRLSSVMFMPLTQTVEIFSILSSPFGTLAIDLWHLTEIVPGEPGV